MRNLPILHGLRLCGAAAGILFVFYFFYQQKFIGFAIAEPSGWEGTRLVVFGDDWSDTESYRVPPLSHSSVATRDPDRGELWVETVCRKVSLPNGLDTKS